MWQAAPSYGRTSPSTRTLLRAPPHNQRSSRVLAPGWQPGWRGPGGASRRSSHALSRRRLARRVLGLRRVQLSLGGAAGPEAAGLLVAACGSTTHLSLGFHDLSQLPALPPQLAALGSSLRGLSLSGCCYLGRPRAATGAWAPLAALPGLQTLNLTRCDLAQLPRELGELQGSLRTLVLRLNPRLGEGRPETLWQPLLGLTLLQRLDLSACRCGLLPLVMPPASMRGREGA